MRSLDSLVRRAKEDPGYFPVTSWYVTYSRGSEEKDWKIWFLAGCEQGGSRHVGRRTGREAEFFSGFEHRCLKFQLMTGCRMSENFSVDKILRRCPESSSILTSHGLQRSL